MTVVEEFLKGLGLEQYVELFAENGLEDEALPTVTDADLQGIGIKALFHRKKILQAIASLGAPAAASALPQPPASLVSERPDIDQLPFPVAYPWHWANDPALDADARCRNAIFTCYQAMRLAALLLLSDYLEDDEVEPSLGARIRGLRQPHWAEWKLLADDLARFWTTTTDRTDRAAFRALAEGWMSVSAVSRKKKGRAALDPFWQPLLEGFPGTEGGSQAFNAIEAMQEVRNRRAHREGVVTLASQAQQGEELKRVLPLVAAVIERLFPPDGFTLIRAIQDKGSLRIIRLDGPHPDLKFETQPADLDWEEELWKTDVAALTDDRALTVYPLLVPTEDAPITGLGDPVVMVDGIADAKLTVMGVKNGATLKGAHLAAALAALKRKHADLSLDRHKVAPWTVEAWARMTTSQTVEDITGRKYFPAFYLERPSVDGAVGRYRDQEGRALLVLGEAGSGKSSLLARLVDRLIGGTGLEASDSIEASISGDGGGDVVAFLTGRADYGGTAGCSGDRLLVDVVLRKLGVCQGAFQTLADLVGHLEAAGLKDTNRSRLTWLVLDGVNEADRYTDLVRAIDAFVPMLANAKRTRLVVSMRTGAHQSLATRGDTLGSHGPRVFTHEDRFLTFLDAKNEDHPWLEARPFSPHREGPEAFALRRDRMPERATSVPYERLSPGLKELLLTPLYLHLFHETWAGRGDAPEDLDEGALLDAYLDQISGKGDGSIGGAGTWIERLAEAVQVFFCKFAQKTT